VSLNRDEREVPSISLHQDDPATLRSQIQWQSTEIASLQLRQQDLERRAEGLQADLVAMQQSTSWKLTAPLRALTLMLRWCLSGRPGHVLVECVRLLQRERRHRGIVGMLRRMPRYVLRAGHVVASIDHDHDHDIGIAPGGPANASLPPRLHPDLIDGITDAACIEATVSVIIPTLNAGPEFAYLLRKLRTQLGVRRIEIVIVDSGSTDATVAMAHAAGAVVVEIAPAEFSHSGARNLGAITATGDHLLFMVQDAYPIGPHWIYGLLAYLQDHASEGLVALSCAEYCRDDSDMMYECNIATYYRFLGCKEVDRIASFRGADHESLRTMGQLSDVSCLIPRDRFLQYKYRGRFAEDIDLGVRLIQDGHRIAMLASVKVIHSHNRTSFYYLKRSFVDITFLVDVFPDFVRPIYPSARGLVSGAVHVANHLSRWLPRLLAQGANGSVHTAVSSWLQELRDTPIDGAVLDTNLHLGDARVDTLLRELSDAGVALSIEDDSRGQSSAQAFLNDFVMRFDFFNRYAAEVYPGEDQHLLVAWAAASGKVFSASLGSTLADLHLDRRHRHPDDTERQWLDRVSAQLTAGV
jgi:glycosyltransferase involved in cell wall biosynthesis